jgi:ADP-ribose pyrophosphatase YjhB (NUDIX family)
MEHKNAAVCLVIRNKKILMVTHKYGEIEHHSLPGGGIEVGETPENAAIRELWEECGVRGVIIKKLSETAMAFGENIFWHSFLVDIGNQEPKPGLDPELAAHKQTLSEVNWMPLSEISERDRVFLWSAGLAGIKEFFDEFKAWGNDRSYPNLTP